MTDLLTQSLCELLPYKTICKDCETDFIGVLSQVDVGFGIVGIKGTNTLTAGNIPYCKPYLFPLSSMTEEQKEIYCELQQKVIYNNRGLVTKDVIKYLNWCYENHLDINELIPIGLAIDATGLNIY